jgi:O-antigen/teichoic acid export membrane protein
MGNLLMGQGFTKFNMNLTLLTVVIGFPTGFLLISRFGVLGLIASSLTVGLPSLFIGLRFIKKHFEVSVDWVSSAKILFSSIITAILTYILISRLAFIPHLASNPIRLVIGIIAFVVIFIAATLGTRTINRADLYNLREIINVLGPLRRPLGFLLNLIEKLMTTLHLI